MLRLSALAAGAAVLLASTSGAGAAHVTIVLTEAEVYQQMASALKTRIESEEHTCRVVKISREVEREVVEIAPARDRHVQSPAIRRVLDELADVRTDVMVTLGSRSTALALQARSDAAIVFCLIPNALDRSFVTDEQTRNRLAGLTTDIAPEDHIRWIQRLSPRVRSLGILHSERSSQTVEAIAQAARSKNLRVEMIPASKDRFGDAVQALSDRGCDGALMIADAEVYDSSNVQSILLWGLRGQKPVWTFSAHVVRAGAFAAVFVDNTATVDETLAIVKRLLEGEEPRKIGVVYPAALQTALNERTSELIGISIDRRTLESLTMRLGK